VAKAVLKKLQYIGDNTGISKIKNESLLLIFVCKVLGLAKASHVVLTFVFVFAELIDGK
jgi:hypothetical protein